MMRGEHESTPELRLWSAVLLQALDDLVEHKRGHCGSAWSFFFRRGSMLGQICHWLDLDVGHVRRRAMASWLRVVIGQIGAEDSDYRYHEAPDNKFWVRTRRLIDGRVVFLSRPAGLTGEISRLLRSDDA